MARTYNDLYLDTRQRLRKAGIESAQLEARELICYATGKSLDDLIRDSRLYAPRPVEQKLESLLSRRLEGEPVAYILGEWNFYGLTLDIDHTVLIPRPDTEIIAERAIELAKMAGEHARVLDLCSGSGCIGLAVAQHAENCRIVLADLSEDAIRLSRKNARRNELQSRVTCIRLDAREDPPDLLWDFNLIVCNPPYIRTGDLATLDPSVRNYEPMLALDGGEDGLDFYRVIAKKWKAALRRTGTILFEVGYDQAEDVAAILSQCGYHNITRHKDYNGILRGVEATL
ncbi:MAG: peptide chain release factor N(5)-glutamine methyltransferase [Candidatus Onthomonas sp.]|nr:peptide chain release factor N(5)-glutamine methyltransferase [Candidatus Onthomonas sp.]